MSRTRTAAATARRPVAPRAPRRVSGPVRPRAVPGQPRPRTPIPQPTTGTLAARIVALPDNRWLDRLLRSRAWIWLLGVALGGIVAMQVSLLGMNSGISKSVDTATDLQHSNAALEKQIAELQNGDRVRQAAADLGLVSPDAGAVTFLQARPRDAARAAGRYTAPSDEARANLAAGGVPAGSVIVTDPAAATTDPTEVAAVPAPTADPVTTTTETAPVATTAPVTPAPTAAPPTTTTTTATAPATTTGTETVTPTDDSGAAVAP